MLIESCLCGRKNGALEQHGDVLARRCPCGISRLETEQSAEDVERQYEDGSYHESEQRHANCVPYAQRYSQDERVAALRVMRYRHILNGRFNEGARVLDVGCANGAFVDVAAARGYAAIGIDPHPVGQGARLYAGSLAKLPANLAEQRFDVITYHDVLEHVLDPRAELRRARAALAPHGTVIVDVPDVSTPAGQHHWKHEHLWYFTGLGLAALLQETGFAPLTVDVPVPGKLVVYGEALR